MEKAEKIRKYAQQVDPTSITTISDLQEKEFCGHELNREEAKALRKFRHYRIKKLEKIKHKEAEFHDRYEYLRALSNLVDYRDFLSKQV